MKIVIKTTNIKLTPTLEKYIEEKLGSLEKFAKIFQAEEKYFNHFFAKGKPRVEAWLEIGKSTLHHQKGPFFWAECQMKFPRQSLRVSAQREDLKSAIVEVKDELQRELKQYKEKINSQTKRRARALKKEFKIAPQARFWRKGRIRDEGV